MTYLPNLLNDYRETSRFDKTLADFMYIEWPNYNFRQRLFEEPSGSKQLEHLDKKIGF